MIACCIFTGVVMAADDAYIKAETNRWTLGTATMQRVIALEDGRLLLKSFKNRTSGRELVSGGAASGEFSLRLGEAKEPITGATGPWKLIHAEQAKLSQGELQLDLTIQRESLQVTKSYMIYPGSSIVRQWITIKNVGDQPLIIGQPGFLAETVRPGNPEDLDFHWMTGGENQPGSWMLKTETLSAAKPRTFDSYEPFKRDAAGFPGDGINATVLLNGKQVWPASGVQYVSNGTVKAPVEFSLDVAAGDKLAFVVNMNGNYGWDTTAFDPTIKYDDGETHAASREFSDRQGQNGWRYQYIEGQQYVDLVYYPGPKQWRKEKDNATGTPFIGVGDQHPDANQDAARVWTAPKAGRVHVAATVCNTGNQSGGSAGYGFRMGSSTYAPWYALLAKDTRDGVVIGWDYFGHWASSFQRNTDGSVTAELKVAGHKQTLAPGASLVTPKAFVGLFRGDLDEAGNEVLDWQYRYLWDYTRDKWFPAIRVLGYWMRGTAWGEPGLNVGWVGGKPDPDSTFRKVFRVADLMRRIGGDVYHRDWGWWDRAGDWNGPDFRATGEYLRKSGMGQLIYAFLYTVDPQSQVAKEHPDWVIGETLDMSKPEVVDHIKRQLDTFHERWGDFEWRNDSTPTCPRNGDDTPLLGQDAGLRQVLRDFLDKYPGCAFQAVNGGGNNAGYDYARYASTVSFSDGAVGIIRNYHASLILPPDKTSDIPDIWNPASYDKATWRGLLCINFDMTGDTWDPVKLEGLRELIDIYHYLQKHNVVGRWVKVYRPTIVGDPDPTMYFQRLSGDRKKGIIIPKRPAPGAVTIKPKGLLPEEIYTVSFHESDAMEKRTGKDLMQSGIQIEKMLPGELVYLNLPLHPGSKLDKEPPTAPADLQKQAAENMGYPGVELTWTPGADNNWVSYYEVYRNGEPVDRVAKGTYYFDHSAGADLAAKYEVLAVDGAGNASSAIAAAGPETKPSRIVDDPSNADIRYAGKWQSQSDLPPAHAGTLTSSNEQGASVSLTFEGKRVLWFSKLGANAGKAAVGVDDAPPETIDTYSADDIWGVCVYRKEFPTAGRHTLKITVLGQHGPRAKDSSIAIDGFRIEP
ncbi:MAG: hypothetical protein NTW96_02630 [Planctomycetia bacterium]|nr:hypothetical protein [Planctomycetia bacterium]